MPLLDALPMPSDNVLDSGVLAMLALLIMGWANDLRTTKEWAMFTMPHVILKKEYSEDMAHTSRHVQIFVMLIPRCNLPTRNPR